MPLSFYPQTFFCKNDGIMRDLYRDVSRKWALIYYLFIFVSVWVYLQLSWTENTIFFVVVTLQRYGIWRWSHGWIRSGLCNLKLLVLFICCNMVFVELGWWWHTIYVERCRRGWIVFQYFRRWWNWDHCPATKQRQRWGITSMFSRCFCPMCKVSLVYVIAFRQSQWPSLPRFAVRRHGAT